MAPAAATNKCYYALLGYPINSAPGSFRAEVPGMHADPLVWHSQNCNSGNPQHRLEQPRILTVFFFYNSCRAV